MIIKYRPEIDGLRAIAVLAVVFFHLGFTGTQGGFVGVDIFFVISGYLITTILLQEADHRKLSIPHFYERRIRRILPLLIVIMAFSLIVTWWFYEAKPFSAVGTSLSGCSTFLSNIVFMRRKGYFVPSVHEDPLLHTWSLSVEEQFYIVLPFVLLLLHKLPAKWFKGSLLIITCCSFILNVMLTYKNSNAGFYLAPARAWEFLAGSLLAAGLIPSIKTKIASNVIAYAGLAMIIASIYLFSESIVFPGFYALVPVLGACLIVYSTGTYDSWIKSFLLCKPIVFTGKISYSIYMWHWPMLVFANMCVMDKLSVIQQVFFLLLLLIVSTLSYYFIEQPFRRKHVLKSRPVLFSVSIAALLVFCGIGMVIKNENGMKNRFIENDHFAVKGNDSLWQQMLIQDSLFAKYGQLEYLVIGDVESTPSFVLWGDSHARALCYGIDSIARAMKVSGYIISGSSIPPLTNIHFHDRRSYVPSFNTKTLQFITLHPELKTVILAARWNKYYDKNILRSGSDGNVVTDDILNYGLQHTLSELSAIHRKVYIVLPAPELTSSVNKIVFRERLFKNTINDFVLDTIEYQKTNKRILSTLYHAEVSNNVKTIDIARYLEVNDKYPAVIDGRLLYRDANHLSPDGSVRVAPAFAEVLTNYTTR